MCIGACAKPLLGETVRVVSGSLRVLGPRSTVVRNVYLGGIPHSEWELAPLLANVARAGMSSSSICIRYERFCKL